MNSGTKAATEITTNMLTTGERTMSHTRERPMAIPSGIPTTQARPKPVSIC